MSDAASTYLALAEPDRAKHLWRYTPWRHVHPTGSTSDLPETSAPLLTLTTMSGVAAPDTVRLSSATAADVERLSGGIDFKEGGTAGAFIEALTGGEATVLSIDAGCHCSEPLVLNIEASGAVSALHLLLDVGDCSEVEIATVIQGDADWTGLLREGRIGASAILDDVVVQRTAGRLLRLDGIVHERDAQVMSATVAANGSRVKADLRHLLEGRGANLRVLGSLLATSSQHQDHHIEIQHAARDSVSRLAWHAACSGKSTTIGTGMLRIDKGATGSDAAQLFHNLLLSEKAKANSIPELEVLEFEVVGCGHGTANGPPDADQAFYLQARGLSAAETRATLTAAFLNATLSKMGSEVMHQWLLEQIGRYLESI